jgi:hypothetical protein
MSLAEKEATRAARKALLKEQYEAQREKDIEQLDALETEHGDSNVAYEDFAFIPGLPTLAVVRCPSEPELKRFRYKVKPVKGEVDAMQAIDASEELATCCIIYPDKDTYARMKAAKPGIHVRLGTAALGLVQGSIAEKGKG